VHLPRTKRLLDQVRSYCKDNAVLQKTLANQLGLSPTAMNEIFQERNNPSCEIGLHMMELMESQFMSTPVFEPKPDRPPRADDPDQPRTLARAIARIDQLNAELKQLRGAPSQTATGAPKPAAPATRATASTDRTPVFDATDPKTWTNRQHFTPFPVNCDSPKAITEYLSTLSTEALRGYLKGSPTTETEQLQQKLVLTELQNRRKL
jgi:DNA-binding XRE family transcriptional regulator